MGADIPTIYTGLCGTSTGKPVDIEPVEVIPNKNKELQKYKDLVLEIDRVKSKNTFKIDNYANNKGTMLYIFYLKMFEIQETQSNRSWLSPISVGTEFDVSEKEN
eukprot:325505_1